MSLRLFYLLVQFSKRPNFVSQQSNVVFNGKFKGNVTNLKLKEQKNIFSVFHRFGKFLVVLSKKKNVEFLHFKILRRQALSLLISMSTLTGFIQNQSKLKIENQNRALKR